MDITKKEFEQILDKRLDSQTKIIVKRIDKAQEELARITNVGFEDVLDRLDVRERMNKLETDMVKIKAALDLN